MFWAWTIWVVYRQKKAWKFYSDKKKLRYTSNGFLETPSISGAISGYKVSIFASEHSELDARSQRRLTAIEVTMHSGLPFHAAIASGGMVPVVDALALPQEYKPSVHGWDDSYIIRTRDNDKIEKYLDEKRSGAIVKLMQVENSWVILLFLGEYGLLRLDTPKPIDDPKLMDKLIKQLIDVAKTLELDEKEKTALSKKGSKSGKRSIVIAVDEKLLEDDIGFELEDDQP